MATGEEELRQVMYHVIRQLVDDGSLVPVYKDGELVDITVNMPGGRRRDN